MDFTQNKDDPHGVQRLLDILRRQQDSSSSSAPSTSSAAPSSSAAAFNPFSQPPSSAPTTSTSHESDAAARRRTYNTPSTKYGLAEEPFDPYAFNPFSASSPALSSVPAPPKPAPPAAPRDLAALSFADSLPILSTLASDTSLLKRLSTLRTQQHDLERRLTKEYRQFAATADKQYPNPKLRREEDERRRTEMLSQWDACVKRQQEEMQRAGVPGVRVTSERRETDKQRRVVGVLSEMMDEGA